MLPASTEIYVGTTLFIRLFSTPFIPLYLLKKKKITTELDFVANLFLAKQPDRQFFHNYLKVLLEYNFLDWFIDPARTRAICFMVTEKISSGRAID